MAGQGVIQAELAIEIGRSLAALNQAQAAIAKFSQGVGASVKPANDAVEGLSKSFQNFKRDQVQEGRMVGFYVREMTSFAGATAGTQAALGGLTQGVIGLATATGPVLALWAGFELFKGVFELITENTRKASEEMKKFVDESRKAVDAGTKASISLATGERNKLLTAEGGDPVLSSARAEAIAAVKTLRDFESRMGISGKSPSGDVSKFGMSAEQLVVWGEMTDKVKKASAALREYQTLKPINDDISRGALGPGSKAGIEKFGSESGKAQEAAKKVSDEVAKTRNMWMETFGPGNDQGVYVFTQAQKAMDDIQAGIRAQNAREAASYDAGTFDLSGVSSGEVNTKRMQKEMEAFNAEAAKTADIFGTIGSSIGSAFSSIGKAVGGAGGAILEMLGSMIQQAVALAISLAMASMAWTTPLGMVAMGAIALAGITTLISSIPSYDVGSSYVPQTQLAMVHKGERIVTAEENARGSFGGSTNITIQATDAQSFERMLRQNDNALVRVLRDAGRAGRA